MVTGEFRKERVAHFSALAEAFRSERMPRKREEIVDGMIGKVSKRNRGVDPWKLVVGNCCQLGEYYIYCSFAKIWQNDLTGWEDYWLGTRMMTLSELYWIHHANVTNNKHWLAAGSAYLIRYLSTLVLVNNIELAERIYTTILPTTWRAKFADYDYNLVGLEPMLVRLLGRRFEWRGDFPNAPLGPYAPIIEKWDDPNMIGATLKWMCDDRAICFKVDREWLVVAPALAFEVPVEVLIVYRVRGDLGYETPRFAHKVLYEPFCNIPKAIPRTTDPQLDLIVDWMHRQYPELSDLQF